MAVHPTAVVHEGAELGEDVEIGPYCTVGPKVRLGARTRLHAHVVVEGDTWLGEECEIYPYAVVGTTPQDKKLARDTDFEARLRIGARNQIREHVTVHGGTPFGGGLTQIGDDNMLLVGSHVGHDSTVGSSVVFTNGAMVAGHTVVEDRAILGAMVGVHQFTRVGTMAMVGAGAMLSRDAPPFAMVQGDRARLVGVNRIGLKRAGLDADTVERIKRAFRQIFWRAGRLAERIAAVRSTLGDDEVVGRLLNFIEDSKRGVVMPRGRRDSDESRELAEH